MPQISSSRINQHHHGLLSSSSPSLSQKRSREIEIVDRQSSRIHGGDNSSKSGRGPGAGSKRGSGRLLEATGGGGGRTMVTRNLSKMGSPPSSSLSLSVSSKSLTSPNNKYGVIGGERRSDKLETLKKRSSIGNHQLVPKDVVMADVDNVEVPSDSSPLSSLSQPLADCLNLPPVSERSSATAHFTVPLEIPSSPPGLTRPLPRSSSTTATATHGPSWRKLNLSPSAYFERLRKINPHAPKVISGLNPDRQFLPRLFVLHQRSLIADGRTGSAWYRLAGSKIGKGHLRSRDSWFLDDDDDTMFSAGASSVLPCSRRDPLCAQWRNPSCRTCQDSGSIRCRAIVAAAVRSEHMRLQDPEVPVRGGMFERNEDMAAIGLEKDNDNSRECRFKFTEYDADEDQDGDVAMMMNVVEDDHSKASLADELAGAGCDSSAMIEVDVQEQGQSLSATLSHALQDHLSCPPPTPRPKLLDSFDDDDEYF